MNTEKTPIIVRNANGVAVLVFDNCKSQVLSEANKGMELNTYDLFRKRAYEYKNITAEYLANTYGEVKSKEHAEFIVRLCENAGIEFGLSWREGDFFCIYKSASGFLNLDFVGERVASNSGEKQITIPLPPECEETEENNMVAAKYEKTDRERTLELMHECYHEMSGDFYDFSQKFVDMVALNERESVDEWPVVGSKALLNNDNGYELDYGENLIGKEVKVISLFTDGDLDMAVVKHDVANYCFRVEMLSKPKPKEEKERDEIKEEIKEIFREAMKTPFWFIYDSDEKAANYLIERFDIKKKPQ